MNTDRSSNGSPSRRRENLGFEMIIAAFRRVTGRPPDTFPAKAFEKFFAYITIGFGVALSNPIATFDLSPSYRVFQNLMSENAWAQVCLIGGFARLFVIALDGLWYRAYLLRTLASLSSLALFLTATLAFAVSGTSSTGVFAYGVMFVYEFKCTQTTGYEAGRIERAEWARFATPERRYQLGSVWLSILFVLGLTSARSDDADRPT